jgi:pilus assembly protein CpaE
MIIPATNSDDALAIETQKLLSSTALRSLPMEIVALVPALESLVDSTPSEQPLFVVGQEFAPLSEAIRRVHTAAKRPVIAIAKNGDSRQILQLIRAGAADYVDLVSASAQELTVVMSRLRERYGGVKSRGKLIGVASSSGGCGASSIAVNLGTALATKNNSICMLDLNLAGGGLACLLNQYPPHTISDLCSLNRQIDESAFESAIVKCQPNLGLLAAPVFSSNDMDFDPGSVEQIVKISREKYSHIVADLGDASRREHCDLILECDLLVIAFRLEFPCILRTRELLRHLTEMGVEKENIRLAANRCVRRAALPRNKVMDALGVPIAAYLPEEPDLMLTAINVGAPIIIEAPGSKFAKSIREFAEALSL